MMLSGTPEKTAYRIDWPAFYEGFSAPNESHFIEPNPDEVITAQRLSSVKSPRYREIADDEGLSAKSLNSPPVSDPAGLDAFIT